MPTPRELVVNYLHTLTERGVTQMVVDDGARTILREWMLAAKQGRPVRPLNAPAPESAAMPAAGGTAETKPAPAEADSMVSEIRRALRAPSQQQETEDAQGTPFFRPGGSNPEEVWANFRRILPQWEPLTSLGTLRRGVVFGQGRLDADIMFVGDCPGYRDEAEGAPFCGEAGAKLDGMLKAMGLTRQDVYITHLVKSRPALPRQTTNNRAPNEKEIAISAAVLETETRLVQPKVIVALGVIAARGILQQGELPLSAYQQMQGHFCGIPVVVTHHPSYLIRTKDLAERRRLWEEMLRVMRMVGLPISDRQQSYFLPAK